MWDNVISAWGIFVMKILENMKKDNVAKIICDYMSRLTCKFE